MKKYMCKMITVCMVLLVVTFIGCVMQQQADARKLTSVEDAKKEAKKKVKGATVTEVDKDYENGILVYEVELVKGSREYTLVFRISDGKLLAYEWDENDYRIKSDKKIMSKTAVKRLANKKVKNAVITSVLRKKDDGVDVYVVKLKTSTKKYELEYHARTGKLLEFKWELLVKEGAEKTKYIGAAKAKEIALKKVPGATVVKVEFDKDDGVPVYEVELVKGKYEYEIEIHAITGKILNYEKELRD